MPIVDQRSFAREGYVRIRRMSEGEPPPTSASPRRRRRAVFALAAIVVGVLAAGVVGEVALRIGGVTSEPQGHFRPGIYAADPELGWGLQPRYQGAYHANDLVVETTVNSLGYRGPEWDEARQQAALRVLVVGDSCTLGMGVGDEETYSAVLERALRERGLDAAVFNAGVSGYDTVQEAAVLRRLLPVIRPHVVVVGWLPNDVIERASENLAGVQVHEGYLVEGDESKYRDWRRRIDHVGLYSSALYRFYRVWTKRLKNAAGVRRAHSWDEVDIGPRELGYSQAPIQTMLELARAAGTRAAVLVLFPRKEEVVDDHIDLKHHHAMAAFGLEQGLEVVDLPARWRAEGRAEGRYLLRDSVHMTPSGYEEIGRAIAECAAFR
jgi:lysophospholipase L1-like esterase